MRSSVSRYTQVPGLPKGYPIGDLLSVLVPEGTSNLVLNPRTDRNTTGFTASNGSAIARSTAQQSRGAYSLAVTPSSNVNSGTYYTPGAVTSTQVYAYAVDVWGAPGVPYRIAITDSSANILNRFEFRGEGRWRRYWVSATPGVTSIRLYVEKNNSASTAVFYVSGFQLEAKAYPTTYCDGDMVGFIPTRADFYWTGTPHASTSVRSAQTRAGGRVMRLSQYGFTLLSIIGLGMLPWVNIDTPAGLQGGAYYQRSVPERRSFTLLGDMREASRPQLDRRQSGLINALRPDLVTPPQPLILRYQLVDDCTGEPLGDALDIECSLEPTGPGNTLDNNHGAVESLSFKTYLPMLQKELSGGASLGLSTSVSNENYIAQRGVDGVWAALGSGMNAQVKALADGGDGTLYAGGDFTTAGGGAANRIAAWSGTAWAALGTGMNGTVNAIVRGPDGTIYAAGNFTTAGGGAANYVAKWNGSAWSALGTGMNAQVYALAIGPDGTLYAGGAFTTADGGAANYIAKWNGSVWSALSTGMSAAVRALVIGRDNLLYAGGEFNTAGGTTVNRIAKWTGTAWATLASGINNSQIVYALEVGADGTLYAGGAFSTASGTVVNEIARWNGVAWSPMGSTLTPGVSGGTPLVGALRATPEGLLYVGGDFTGADGLTLPDSLAVWNGSTWLYPDVNLPSTPTVWAIHRSTAGVLTVGFTTSGSATAASVTSVTVGGSCETWARVEFVGPGTLVQLVNVTTGQAIYFNLTLLSGERAVLDLRPDRLSFVSNFRGDISSALLPGSQETSWRLQPGVNSISVYMSGTDANSAAVLSWREAHSGVQSGTQ